MSCFNLLKHEVNFQFARHPFSRFNLWRGSWLGPTKLWPSSKERMADSSRTSHPTRQYTPVPEYLVTRMTIILCLRVLGDSHDYFSISDLRYDNPFARQVSSSAPTTHSHE
jgi:hypothetical protein